MATAAPSTAGIPALFWAFGELYRREPVFTGTAFVLAILTLPLLVAYGLDGRELLGVNIWAKPIKFTTALSVYLGTLAWFAGWLPEGATRKRWYRAYAVAVVACTIAEMIWIVGAAAYGTASHFNVTTSFLQSIYSLMGLLAVMLTSASLVFGILIWCNKTSPLGTALNLSVALGLVLTFVTTIIVAGYMASRTSHLVGGDGTDMGGLALMGWSRTAGDLRVPHFFATHTMHALPLVGFLASLTLPPEWGRAMVATVALGYVALIAYAFISAINGQPFLPALRL